MYAKICLDDSPGYARKSIKKIDDTQYVFFLDPEMTITFSSSSSSSSSSYDHNNIWCMLYLHQLSVTGEFVR